MMRPIGQLWAGAAVIWLVLAIPAWLIADVQGWVDSAFAAGLCLIPMTVTLWWCRGAMAGSADQQLTAILGGSGVRLVAVLCASIGLFLGVEALHRPAFLIWVVVFYLATLALEVALIVRWQNAVTAPARTETHRN
jgi:hypothetical protein